MSFFRIQWSRVWRAISPDVSADYRVWRQTFLRDRLKLAFWLVIPCCLTFMGLNSYTYLADPQAYAAHRVASHGAFVGMYGATLGCLLVCLRLLRSRIGDRHPEWIFVGLSWSSTLIYQIFATIHGVVDPSIEAWSLLFPTQAALMPVCLPLHLLSQLGLVVYFFGVNSLLGLTIQQQPVYSHLTLWIWLFWLCIICDIAVYLYERLQRSEFESRRELRLFVHAISHDLRSPAVGSAIVLNNLLKQAKDHTIWSDVSVVERLVQSNNRQLRLIDSLIETHRTETQGLSLCLAPLQLSTVVSDVLSDLATVLKAAHTRLENTITPDLLPVRGDATQLWRVYSNLINNAVSHNPPGIRLLLAATIVQIDNIPWVRCTVQDNGVGIAPEHQSRLFKLYTRGNQARRQPGLGLGLYLCQQIIHAHGGNIGVNSIPQAGTTFWFTLPFDGQATGKSR
ncbi:MAG: HAMP domain-containing sensor histidine kinase [Cyanobacteria bacterium P01_H01_bin.153]